MQVLALKVKDLSLSILHLFTCRNTTFSKFMYGQWRFLSLLFLVSHSLPLPLPPPSHCPSRKNQEAAVEEILSGKSSGEWDSSAVFRKRRIRKKKIIMKTSPNPGFLLQHLPRVDS